MAEQQIDLSRIAGRTLTRNSHRTPDDGMCVMEAVAYCVGEKFSDFPTCTPREVSRLAQRINDGYWDSDEARTDALSPLIPMLASCERSDGSSQIRAFMCADRGRLWAADAVELRGFSDHAETIRAIPTIVDHETAVAARTTIRGVRSKLNAAYAAYAAYVAYAAYAAYVADAAAYAADAAADAADAAAAAYAADAAAAAYAAAAYAADARQRRQAECIELLVAMCSVRTEVK